MNSINLIGNICQDVELKQTNSGKSVVSFNLAVQRPFSKDTTDFIPLVIYGQPAEYISRYANKGTKIAVCGKLTTRNYEDKNGNKRTAFEVVADSAELCGSATEKPTEPKNEPSVSVPNPTQRGKSSGYTPSAYTQPSLNTSSLQFEEIPGDEKLPF